MVDGVMKRSFFFRNDRFYSPDRLDQAFDEVWTAVNFVVGHAGLSVNLVQETINLAVDKKLSSVRQNDASGLSERLLSLERAIAAVPASPTQAIAPALPPASPPSATYDDSKILVRIDVIERRLTDLHNVLTSHTTSNNLHAPAQVSAADFATVSNGMLSLDERLKATETVLDRLKEMVS